MEIYTKDERESLISVQKTLAVVLFGILLYGYGPYLYLNLSFLLISLVAITVFYGAGVYVVTHQDKNINFGYIIFVNLAVEIYFWIRIFSYILERLIKRHFFDRGFLISIFILLTISIFTHLFIVSSLFEPTARKKLLSASLAIILLFAFVGGGMVINASNSQKVSEWKVYSTDDYSIKAPPVLGTVLMPTVHDLTLEQETERVNNIQIGRVGFSFGPHQTIKEWFEQDLANAIGVTAESSIIDSITPYFDEEGDKLLLEEQEQSWARSIENTLSEEAYISSLERRKKLWASYIDKMTKDLFSKQEILTIENYEVVKLPTVPVYGGQSYAVYIFNRLGITKFQCTYKDDEMKDICEKVLATFRFK